MTLNNHGMGNVAVRTGASLGILAAALGVLALLFLGERNKERRETVTDWLEETKEKAKKKMDSLKDDVSADRHFELRSGKHRIHVGYETEA